MGSERKSARQPRIIKKEPTYAMAPGTHGDEPPSDDGPERWIPIDLAQALPGVAITDSMQIILEGVPDGARLSPGRNNGDKTWSLSPQDLIELAYLPPPGRNADGQAFLVRLISYDPDGYQIASTTAQVGVDVNGVKASRSVRLADADGGPGLDAIREAEFARRLTAAEESWRQAEAARVAALEAAWLAASEEQLNAAATAWRQAEADRTQALRDDVADYARRLRDAESEWQREETERISAALAQAADFTAQRFDAAEAQWRAEAERRLAEAERERALEFERWVAETEKERADEFDRRLATEVSAVETKLRTEFQETLAAVRAENDEKLRAQRDQLEQAERARRDLELDRESARIVRMEDELARVKTAAEAAALGFQRDIDERQQAWEMERTAIMAAVATDPADSDRMAALEQRWRLEAERLSRQAEAAARQEADQRLAQAEVEWREISERRLAEAEQQWSLTAERRVSELHAAMAAESEERLGVMRRRMNQVERLAGEVDRHHSERQHQLSEAIAAQQELERKLEEALATLHHEQERSATEAERLVAETETQWKAGEAERLSAAEAAWMAGQAERLAAAEAAWREGEAARLAEAQAAWRAGEQDRLADAIAAERILLAGADVSEILTQAEARWREAEAERMAAAESRWKMEEDQRVAAAVANSSAELERLVEARLHRELAVDARRLLGHAGRGSALFAALMRWCAAGATAALVAGVVLAVAPRIKALLPEPTRAVAEVPIAPQQGTLRADAPGLVVSAGLGLMRAAPDSNSAVVARLERGTPLVELDRRGSWINAASVDGRFEGWVHVSVLGGDIPTPQ